MKLLRRTRRNKKRNQAMRKVRQMNMILKSQQDSIISSGKDLTATCSIS